MNQRLKWAVLLSVFVICAYAVAPVAGFSGFGETLGGRLGESTWGYYTALARIDMSQEESVVYDLDANRDFIFVVRDLADFAVPLDSDYYEGPFLLNITATSVEGTFRAPYDGTFVFQFFVLFSTDYSWFDLEYELETVTLLGQSIGYAVPWFSVVLSGICAAIWAAAWRWSTTVSPASGDAFLRFWKYFASRPQYWVAPFAGMALCIAVLIVEPDGFERGAILSLAMGLSGSITHWGISLGLISGIALYDKQN